MWGTLPIALEIVLEAMDPFTITWYRFVFSATALALVLRLRGTLPSLRGAEHGVGRLLALATVFLAANYICYLVGLDLTSAGNAQVVIQLAPLLLALGSIWIFRESFSRLQWVGLLTLIVGLGIFSRDQLINVVTDAGAYGLGTAAMLAASVTWAVYGLAQKQLLRWLTSNGVMLVIYAGCTLIFSPLADPATLLELNGLQMAVLAFCAVNTLAAYGTFAEALAHWEASKVSAVLALTPLCTLGMLAVASRLWPELTPPEPVSLVGWAGACLVVTGSLLTAGGGRSLRPESSPPGSGGR